MTTSITVIDQILLYASHGWHVFPLHWPVYLDDKGTKIGCSCGARQCSVGKHPFSDLAPHGFKDATTNEATIRSWYASQPDCNWAMETGIRSGVIVCDIDPRHGGDESLRDLEAKYGSLPLTPRAFTGGGGEHYFFKHPGGHIASSSSTIGAGIDLKADGGYVVVPPSVHEMGRTYRWDIGAHIDDLELADPPEWLYERDSGHSYHVADLALPDVVPQGNRDNTMMSYAGTLRNRGLVESEIYDSLHIVNRRFDPPLDERSLHRIAHSAASYSPGEFGTAHLETAAAEPVKIEDFPAQYLTDLLQVFGRQGAATYDTDPATIICVMLAFASGAMGLWATRLNAEWEESALLWLGLVGDPGMKKTPIIKAVGRPFVEWHKQEIGRFNHEYADYMEDKRTLKRDQLGPEPILKQRLFDDTTMEALAPRFVSDPRGGLIDRDELTGFVASMNQYKSRGGADRSNWLSIWAGRHVTINRKGEQRPTYIERPYLALVGGIQPERLGTLLSEEGNDGFLDRFLFALMPSGNAQGRHRSNLESSTIHRWREVVRYLLGLEQSAFLPLSHEAEIRWQYWSDRHANERNDPELDLLLRGFWAKAEGTTARLALVHQAIAYADGKGPGDVVTEESVEAAWRLMQYFKSTTRKVYGEIEENNMDRRCERLLAFIHGAGGVVTGRELQQAHAAGIKKASEAEMLLDELEDRGEGTVVKADVQGGRRVTFTLRGLSVQASSYL